MVIVEHRVTVWPGGVGSVLLATKPWLSAPCNSSKGTVTECCICFSSACFISLTLLQKIVHKERMYSPKPSKVKSRFILLFFFPSCCHQSLCDAPGVKKRPRNVIIPVSSAQDIMSVWALNCSEKALERHPDVDYSFIPL